MWRTRWDGFDLSCAFIFGAVLGALVKSRRRRTRAGHSRSLLGEALWVIRDLLRGGSHDGPCDNRDEDGQVIWDAGGCTLHLDADKRRREAAWHFLKKVDSANATSPEPSKDSTEERQHKGLE